MSTTLIPRTYVSSTNLRSVGYDDWSGTLEVEFHGGRVYRHSLVPAEVHEALMQSSSKGSYYARRLNNRYGCTRLR